MGARTKIIQNIKVHKKNLSTPNVYNVLLKNCRHIWVGPNNNELLIDLICQRATGVTIQLWSDYMADPMSLLEFSSIDFVTLCDQIESPSSTASVPFDIKLKSQWYLLDVKQKSRWVGPVHYNYNNSSFLKTNIFSIWLNNSWNISTICVPHATVAAVSQSLLMYFFCSKSSFLCRSSVNLASPLETDICFLATILTSYLGVH